MDILRDLDDLDSDLFGSKPNPKTATGGGTKSAYDSLFGGPTTTEKPKRQAVSFLDSKPSKTSLDDLFKESTSSEPKSEPRPTSAPRPGRQKLGGGTGGGTLASLLGGPTKEPEPAVAAPVAVAQAPVTVPTDTGIRQEDQIRIRRLEEEIERLNREIDDLKRKKQNDLDDQETFWKSKLAKKEKDLFAEFDEERQSLMRQINKLRDEHSEELERLKITQSRQLEALQTTTGQATDITTVVDRVDNLSSTIGKLTNDVVANAEKSFLDREMSIKIREQAVESREERFKEDREQLLEEKKKVYELNAKLDELCKGNQTVMEQDKWRIRDEWSRLNAEKQVFKDDQKYIMDALERQKETLEKTKSSFMKEQHDLVVRVSTERASLEQERNEFFVRRNLDVRRLKEEATELQHKVDSVEIAEREVFEMKRHFEGKLNELQELEASLMEECLELERIRDQIRSSGPPPEQFQGMESGRRSSHKQRSTRVESPDFPKRNESVRTVLKNHSEFLEKYIGQKVAAVAPQTNGHPKRDFLN